MHHAYLEIKSTLFLRPVYPFHVFLFLFCFSFSMLFENSFDIEITRSN